MSPVSFPEWKRWQDSAWWLESGLPRAARQAAVVCTPLTLVSLPTGMCLQAFVEAFFYLAQRKFKMLPLHKQVASLIDLCEYHLSLLDEKRLVCGRSGRPGGRPPYSSTPQEATPADPPAEGGLRPCTAKLSHPRHTPA